MRLFSIFSPSFPSCVLVFPFTPATRPRLPPSVAFTFGMIFFPVLSCSSVLSLCSRSLPSASYPNSPNSSSTARRLPREQVSFIRYLYDWNARRCRCVRVSSFSALFHVHPPCCPFPFLPATRLARLFLFYSTPHPLF